MPQELAQYNTTVPFPNQQTAPVLSVPQVPVAAQYRLPAQQAQAMNAGQSQQGAYSPPKLYDYVMQKAKASGTMPTLEDFNSWADEFWTKAIAPIIWSGKGATQGSVAADEAAFKQNAMDKYAQWFPQAAAAPAPDKMGAVGAFLAGAKGGIERGIGGILGLTGGLMDRLGAGGSMADSLMAQANAQEGTSAPLILKQLVDTKNRLLQMYPQDAAKISAELDPKIAAQQAAMGHQNLVQMGNANIQAGQESGHGFATGAGAIAGQILPFFATRGASTALLASGEALGNVGAHAADQLNAGQDVGAVQRQALVDTPLQTLAAFLPVKVGGTAIRTALESGDSVLARLLAKSPKFMKFLEGDSRAAKLINSDKIIPRAVKGAAVGAGFNTAEQAADIAVNPNNKPELAPFATQTALSAALAALIGGKGEGALLRLFQRKDKTAPEATPETKPQAETTPEAPVSNQWDQDKVARWKAAKAEEAQVQANSPIAQRMMNGYAVSDEAKAAFNAAQDALAQKYGLTRAELGMDSPPTVVNVAAKPSTASKTSKYQKEISEAPENGVSDEAFKTVSNKVAKANTSSYKVLKEPIGKLKTPEKLLAFATRIAKDNAGKDWDSLSSEQRAEIINNTASWLSGKAKIPIEDVAAHIEQQRQAPATPEAAPTPEAASTPEAAPSAQATPPGQVTEQPLPAGIEGQQVPGTVKQAEAPAPVEIATSNPLKDKTNKVLSVLETNTVADANPTALRETAKQIVAQAEREGAPVEVWANDKGQIRGTLPLDEPRGEGWRVVARVKPKYARNKEYDNLWQAANATVEPKTGGEVIRQAWKLVHTDAKDGGTPTRKSFDSHINKSLEQAKKLLAQQQKAQLGKAVIEQASEQPTTQNKLKATPVKNKIQQNNAEIGRFYETLLKDKQGKGLSPEETAIKSHPFYSAAKDKFGTEINTREDLKTFLDGLAGKDKYGERFNNIPTEIKKNKLGDLIKSRKDRNNANRKAARQLATEIRDALTSGKDAESITDVNNMTLQQAYGTLNKHVARLGESAEAAAPKKTKGNALQKKAKPKEEPTPKSEAPGTESGANENNLPLDSFTAYFRDKLARKDLEALHDAFQEAAVGEGRDALNIVIKDLKQGGLVSKQDIAEINKLLKASGHQFKDVVENNASGESSASFEAISRTRNEKAKGQTRALIERNGNVHPMITVDAADIHARPGQVIVQRGVGKNEWTVLSQGDDIPNGHIEGILARAKQKLDEVHRDQNPIATDTPQQVRDYAQLRDKIDTEIDAPAKPKVNRLNTKSRVNKIIKEIQNGADVREVGRTLLDLRADMETRTLNNKLKQGVRERRNGPDWVKARLAREIADLPEGMQRAAIEFGQWALERNPNLATGLSISIRNLKDRAGGFSPVARIIALSKTDLGPTTVVHEIMHAAEGMMTPEVQDKVFGEYMGRLLNKIKQQRKLGNDKAVEYLQTAVENLLQPSEQAMRKMIGMLGKDNIGVREFYKYSSPSEYWAEEAANILKRRHEAGSWLEKAHVWMQEFAEHVKKLFGMENKSEVVKALNKVMKSEGTIESPTQIENRTGEFADVNEPTDKELGYESDPKDNPEPELKEAPTVNADTRDLTKITLRQTIVEQLAKATEGVAKAMQHAYRLGVKLTESNNIDNAIYAKRGLTAEYNQLDQLYTVKPVIDYLNTHYQKYANSMPDFMDKLNTFFGYTNWLERGRTLWRDNVALEGDAEIDRARIQEELTSGKMAPEEAAKQMDKLVANNAEMTFEEYAKHNRMPLERIQKVLDTLDKESHINENTMAELNKLVEPMRQRLTQRLQQSGLLDKTDPWVKYYGWKWYVPLKGSNYQGIPDNVFDILPKKNMSLALLNQGIKVMEGRRTEAEKPFARLFVDLSRAGERVANKHVLDTTYQFVIDARSKFTKELEAATTKEAKKAVEAKYRPLLADIVTFTGRPHDGYTNEITGELVGRLKAPKTGLIVPDGDTHYVLNFSHDSQLLRGLMQMNNVKRLGPISGWTANKTNVLARLYTTVNPFWQTSTGFIRDLTYVPITQGATLYRNPLSSLPLIANYTKEVLQLYKALPTFIPTFLGKHEAIIAAAQKDPSSFAAYLRRYEKAGGSNLFTEGFDIPSVERMVNARLQNVDGVWDATKFGWGQILKYTGNYANFLEQLSRVAMFKTLLKTENPATGKLFTDGEAAVSVRKLLDYSESGIEGRRINAFLAFFRVGMTGADAMRRAFTKPGGGLDYAKMAAWQGFLASVGAGIYMTSTALLGEDKMKKVPAYALTSKILFPIGDKVAGVNLGLGLPQIMLAPGVLAAAVSSGHISWKDALHEYQDMLQRNGPLSAGGAKGDTPTDFAYSFLRGFVPTIVRPIVDVSSNTTSFGTPVHTDDPNREMFASDQRSPNTPKEYQEIAEWMRKYMHVDYYPEDIRYFVRSYGGQLGETVAQALMSSPQKEAGGEPGPGRLAGKFFVDTSHYMQNEMFETLDELREAKKRYNLLVHEAQDEGKSPQEAKAYADGIASRDSEFAKQLEAFAELKKAHKNYNAELKKIRSNKLVSDTRKQLQRKMADSELRRQIEHAQEALQP